MQAIEPLSARSSILDCAAALIFSTFSAKLRT
jgi:hypothetical protein